ncbi:MAG: TlpA family protein disulfide reductase [Actinomycetota bacterium]|nr:TlpA family protein disulfide reductase [Actinomycetota bacterium]
MRLMRFRRLAAGLLLLATGAVACTGNDPSPHVPVVPAVNATQAPLLPTNAAALPSFDYAKLQSLLAQLRGTPVVVNIWASWCIPCATEAPLLASAARTYHDRVQFLGIDILDTRDSARTKMKEWGLTYPSLYDGSADVKRQLGFLGQPDTLFYDASGKLVERLPSQMDARTLNAGIERILSA